jgi:hypothetical protein
VKRRIKLLIPWILSLAIVAYVLLGVDLEELKKHIVQADIGSFLGWLAAFIVVVFFADSGTLTILFRRLLAPVTYKETSAIKGVSYFLNALNYSAGSGSMALFLKKKKETSFLEGLSALMWLNFVDIMVLLVMLSLGWLAQVSGFSPNLLPEEHSRILPWLLLGVAGVVVGALIYWRAGFDFFILGKLRKWRVFAAFSRAEWSDYLALFQARFAFILLYVAMAYVTLPCFGVQIDFLALLIYIPLLTFVQIVPASVAGLGALQVVMVEVYGHYAHNMAGVPVLEAEAKVLAYSFFIGPVAVIFRLFIGYFYMNNVTRDFVPTAAEIREASAEARD